MAEISGATAQYEQSNPLIDKRDGIWDQSDRQQIQGG
jgi:hypothetical protein